jgi:hypothetical protein
MQKLEIKKKIIRYFGGTMDMDNFSAESWWNHLVRPCSSTVSVTDEQPEISSVKTFPAKTNFTFTSSHFHHWNSL